MQPIRYAPLPMNNPAFNLAKSQALTAYLHAQLPIPFVPVLYNNYEAILTAFENGEIDLIEVGPLVLSALQKRSENAAPLVSIKHHPSEPHYRCVLAAPIDGIQQLNELSDGCQVALTQPLSTCGWLMSDKLLEAQNIHLENLDTRYLGSHEAVAMALLRKEFQVGGLAGFIAERYADLGLRILASSEPLPPFMLVANKATLSAAKREAIQRALLNYKTHTADTLGIYGFSPFSTEIFERFNRLVSQEGLDSLTRKALSAKLGCVK